MILTPLQKLPKNVGNSGKIIVAIGFEWLPKVQKIAKSGHTDLRLEVIYLPGYILEDPFWIAVPWEVVLSRQNKTQCQN